MAGQERPEPRAGGRDTGILAFAFVRTPAGAGVRSVGGGEPPMFSAPWRCSSLGVLIVGSGAARVRGGREAVREVPPLDGQRASAVPVGDPLDRGGAAGLPGRVAGGLGLEVPPVGIDRLVSRSVTFTLVTATLLGIYLGLVVLLQPAVRPVAGDSDLDIARSSSPGTAPCRGRDPATFASQPVANAARNASGTLRVYTCRVIGVNP